MNVNTGWQDLLWPLLVKFEGFREKPYQDQGGTWTIGYGSTFDLSGKPVSPNTPAVDRDMARKLAQKAVDAAYETVCALIGPDLTPGQMAALVDFVYNEGRGRLLSSTLRKKALVNDMAGAAAEFPKWNLVGGKVSSWQVKRRAAEVALWLQGVPPVVPAAA